MSYGKQLKGDLLQERRLKRPTTKATAQKRTEERDLRPRTHIA
jgi:hypothetical protein